MSNDIKKITPESFIREVESLVQSHNLDYMDAVLHFAAEKGIEVETIASVVKNNSKIKAKIQMQAEDLNLLPKKNRLPL